MALESDKLFTLTKDSRELLFEYARKANELFLSTWSIRQTLQEIDTYYMREGNSGYHAEMAKAANRSGDKSKYRDFTVPIIMPQVEAALGYFTNVFLTGYPIFGVSAGPGFSPVALQLETIFANHAKKAKWAINLQKAFRDNLKYNLMGLYIDWDEITTWDVRTDPTFSATKGKPTQTLWAGNFIKRMDLYNSFWDIRVDPSEVHTHGEYAGYTELMTRPMFKQYINSLGDKIPPYIATMALNSSYGVSYESSALGQYFVPTVNPDAMIANTTRGEFNWLAWAQGGDGSKRNASTRFQNVYARTKIFCRIIPADFKVVTPEAQHAQIWELCIINNSVLLYAKRRTNAHNMLPTIFGQVQSDGLGYQTKSFASNVIDMQDIASTFWNMNIDSKRRMLTDRMFYDPLRIREADINSTNPAAKIPVRPSAYGKTIADAIHVSPYRDEMADRLVLEADMVTRHADRINGQNPAQQGQFVKGNKTRREFEDVMGHANNRNQSMAFSVEHGVLVDVKEILLINTLQNQGQADMYNSSKEQIVKIDPTKLRTALVEFKVSDGMLPADKVMNTEEFAVALQTMQSVPALGVEYQVGDMFAQLMAQRGVDLRPYRKSPALRLFEQQLAAWQQQATLAAENKAPFNTPMPQPSPELVAELQQKKEEPTLMSILSAQAPTPAGEGAAPTQTAPQPA